MKILLSVLAVFVLILVCFFSTLYILKKKRAKEIKITSANGVDYGEFVAIGGIQQYLHHRGEDVQNPVLLFLHGGPGSPMLPFAQEFQVPWENKVTVVHWEQRNCGKTYYKNDPKQVTPTTTIDQVIQDTYEVVEYLKAKYGKDKIIIMGHSWGSVLGSLFTLKYPHLVLGYIGVGQVVNMFRNENVSYERALEYIKGSGNQRDYRALTALSPYPGTSYNDEMKKKMAKFRKLQVKYKLAAGPTPQLIWNVFCSPFYTLRDTRYLLSSGVIETGQSAIMNYLIQTFDLPAIGTKYETPVFYIHGEDDWQTPYPLAKDYFSTVEAPAKQFYSIPSAGHATMLDQKEKFNEALFEILEMM